MRLAQIANFIGPASGGMRFAVEALGRGYAEAGVERLLVVPGPADALHVGPQGTVAQVRAPRVGGAGYRLIVEPWRVVQLLEEFAPDALEVSDKTTLLPVARWARRRGVLTTLLSHERMDDMLAMRTGRAGGSRASIALLDRWVVRSVDQVVVTSRYAEEEFTGLARAAGCPLLRVPLGVDLTTFSPGHAGPPPPSPVLRLALVGRLSREKSPHLAVATAVALHRQGVPVRLDVYGDGPHRAELEALAAGAPVTFHGHVADRAGVARALGAADVALSVCPGETFGLAVLEALACGTPVVTADRGGARELVDRRCGAWAEPTPEALAHAVLDVAARPVGARRRAARARAGLYSWDVAVARMLLVHGAGREPARATA